MKQLRIVTLECPYDNWSDPAVREMFGKIVELKLKGFQREYPYGILPVDGTDFFCTHLLVCEESDNGELLPVMGYKSITLRRCKIHQAAFPLVALMKSVGSPEHVSAVQMRVENCEREGQELAYIAGWTIDPRVRHDQELTAKLNDVFKAIEVLQHSDSNTQVMTLGTLRFHVDRICCFWGFAPISCNGEPLQPVNIPYAFGERVVVFHLKEFTDIARAFARKYKAMWDQRIVLGGDKAAERIKTAA